MATTTETTKRTHRVISLEEAARRITITTDEAVTLYGVNKGTLANLRSKRQGCPFFRVNGKILYQKDQFEEWLFSNPVKTVESTEVSQRRYPGKRQEHGQQRHMQQERKRRACHD